MKTKKRILVLLLVLTVSILSGCTSRDDDEMDELEHRIERLEQQVSDLQSSAASQQPSANTNAPASDTVSQDTVETLTAVTNEAAAKADEATPTGTKEEQRNQFFDLKAELKAAEHQIDSYDTHIESQYKKGILSYEEYLTQEKALKELENKIDTAENKLEWTFGIHD